MTRIEDAGRTMMKELGYKVELGQKISDKMKEDFGAYMAKILFEVIEKGPASPMETAHGDVAFGELRRPKTGSAHRFLGGVSEHVYGRDDTAYGDIGPVLGKNVRARLQHLPKEILREPVEGICHGHRRRIHDPGERQHELCLNEQALPVHGLKVIRRLFATVSR